MTTRKRVFPRGTPTEERRITFAVSEVKALDAHAAEADISLSELLVGRALNTSGGISPAERNEIIAALIGVAEAASALRAERREHPAERDVFDAEIKSVVDDARDIMNRLKR